MIARHWESELGEHGEESLPAAPRLRGQTSPIGHLLSQNLLDEAVRALQEDLAMLQDQQERGLGHLGGTLEVLGREMGAVRAQLSALAEPLLARAAAPELDGDEWASERQQAEIERRFERIEKQVALLVRGMDSVDTLRYQSDVHTRALARLTDLLSEVLKPKPVEGMLELQRAVIALEAGQQRTSRVQVLALSLLGVGLTPGIGALAWLILRGAV